MKKILLAILFFYITVNRSSGQDWNKNLSPQEKIYNLSLIWKDASENFANFDLVPKLNWDSLYQAYIPAILSTKTKYETYRLLEKFICSLRDGHTRMYHFNELFSHYWRFTFNNGTLKFLPTHINHRVFITKVGNKNMTSAIPLGTEILEVNEMPVVKYLEKFVFPYIAASTEQILWLDGVEEMFRGVLDVGKAPNWVVKFKTPEGKIFSLKLTLSGGLDGEWYPAYPEFNPIDFKWLENEIAYVAINGFDKDTILPLFRKLLPELRKSKGVILDLRLNGGGNTNIGAGILNYFTSADTLVGSKWKTKISNAYFKAIGGQLNRLPDKSKLDDEEIGYLDMFRNNKWYEGGPMKFANDVSASDKLQMPLVVLIGNRTNSAAEDFLIMLDGLKGRAVTVGQRTSGSSGQPIRRSFPSGGSYWICTKRDMFPDGREFIGTGIIPDIEVNPEIQDIINGRDVILEKALSTINTMIKVGKANYLN